MVRTLTAVYEQGVLRLPSPLEGLRDGERVLVTVETQETTDGESARREAEWRRSLDAQGLLDHHQWSTHPPPAQFEPIPISGPPLSETIIEDRR